MFYVAASVDDELFICFVCFLIKKKMHKLVTLMLETKVQFKGLW